MRIQQPQRNALREAFQAAVGLLPIHLRGEFVLVGGASLLYIGGDRYTTDIDIASTPLGIITFVQAAGLETPIDLIEQGGGFMMQIRDTVKIEANGGVRAGIRELAVMKAMTWAGRGETHDLDDYTFLINKMMQGREDFGELPAAEKGVSNFLIAAGKEANLGGVVEEILRKGNLKIFLRTQY